ICQAQFGMLSRWDGELSHTQAMRDVPPAYEHHLRSGPRRLGPDTAAAKARVTKQPVHVIDASKNRPYLDREPDALALIDMGGARTLLAVPMLKDEEPIGTITIYRQEVRPFTDKQIELVTSFAAQAVIAIENVRLLNELRESLEQQTAMSEVLRVISASPGELEPVFDAILANATRICDAKFGMLRRYDGNVFHNIAMRDVPPAFADHLSTAPQRFGPQSTAIHAVQTR